MKVSFIVPTCNRGKLWKKRWLLNSIERQTVPVDELLICDDQSDDDTVDILKAAREFASVPIRIFRTLHQKRAGYNDSSMADNILFANATGEVVLHCDDDGFLHNRLVEMVQLLGSKALFYGNNVFLDPDSLKVIGHDKRFDILKCKFDEAIQIPKELCQGALWVCPLTVIKQIGGHDLSLAGYRGCDNRLGWMLERKLPAWFIGNQEMSFYHFGKSQAVTAQDNGTLDQLSYRVPGMNIVDMPETVNGGLEFWAHGLDGMYEEL